MRIACTAFGNNDSLPADFTEKGGNSRPPFRFDGVPLATKSLALIMVDVDSAGGKVHWIVWNIPPNTKELKKGIEIEGTNSTGNKGYNGPNLGYNDGIHRYRFTAYALSTPEVKLQSSAGRSELEREISSKIIEECTLNVRFGRPKPIIKKRKEQKSVNW